MVAPGWLALRCRARRVTADDLVSLWDIVDNELFDAETERLQAAN